MKITGPFVTLAAGAVTGGVLLAMSMVAARPEPASTPTGAAVTAGASANAGASAKAGTAGEAGSAVAAPAASAAASAVPPSPPPSPPPSAAPPAAAAAAAAVPEDELRAYAGRLPGGRYALVLALRGDRAVGYLCDGTVVESWLRGSVAGDRVTLTGNAGEQLSARLVTGRAGGDLTALGRDWSFSISAVEPRSVASVTAKVAP